MQIKIASLPAGVSQWSEHWEKNWNQSWQPKSQKFELTGGSRYYLEALHHGTAPSTGVKVGIQLHNTWLNPDVINTYHREKHEIQASAHQLPEIQVCGMPVIRYLKSLCAAIYHVCAVASPYCKGPGVFLSCLNE